MHRNHFTFSIWVPVVTELRRHRKWFIVSSCRQAVADCSRSRCGLPSWGDSQLDKHADRSTPCEPICCVNMFNSAWSLGLCTSVNWLTIALRIYWLSLLFSSFTSYFLVILFTLHLYLFLLLIIQEHYTNNSRQSSLKSVSRAGKQRSVRRRSNSPIVGVHAL